MGMENINNLNNKQEPKKERSNRLWQTNEYTLKFSVKNIETVGKENLKEIPPNARVVVVTTHLTDLDVPIAIHSVGKELDLSVMNMSVHHKFFGKQGEAPTNIGLHISGKKNFLPIDYEREDSGEKSAGTFNPENFEPAVEAIKNGKAILVAAHKPSKEPLQNLDTVKSGYGGVYLAQLTNAYILPVTVVLDRRVGMYKDNFKMVFKEKPNASVKIGKPFQLEKIDGIENFSRYTKNLGDKNISSEEDLTKFSQLIHALRDQSKLVIKKMSDQLSK